MRLLLSTLLIGLGNLSSVLACNAGNWAGFVGSLGLVAAGGWFLGGSKK